jgi:hypothetical protein
MEIAAELLDYSHNLNKAQTISVRELQRSFGRISKALKPGQTVAVTKRGTVLGYFTRTARQSPPDYVGNLERLGYGKKIGQKLIDQILGES